MPGDLDLSDPALKDRYGATRLDWKPYAGAQPISKILDGIRDSVNVVLTAHRIEWREPPDAFWAGIDEARNFVKGDFNTAAVFSVCAEHNRFRSDCNVVSLFSSIAVTTPSVRTAAFNC